MKTQHAFAVSLFLIAASLGFPAPGQDLKVPDSATNLANMTRSNYADKAERALGLDSTSMDKLLEDHKRILEAVADNYRWAIWYLQGVPDPARTDPSWAAVRRLKTDWWLRLIQQIGSLPVPVYKPDTLLTTHAPAPPGYDSPVPPSVVVEPDLRRAYEELIRRHAEKAAYLLFESRLHDLAEKAKDRATSYLTAVYRKTPEDRKELVGYLETLGDSKLKTEMKEKLKDLLPPPTK
jgi:hypothetical protein